jgi:NSS family neurotransmitter:Na+ symporter
MGIFDFADSFASNVLLVIGGLLSVILVGWVMPRKKVFAELTNRGLLRGNVKLFPLLYILIRYVAPLGILALVIASVLL